MGGVACACMLAWCVYWFWLSAIGLAAGAGIHYILNHAGTAVCQPVRRGIASEITLISLCTHTHPAWSGCVHRVVKA